MQAAPQLQAEIADFMRAAKLQQLVTDTTLNIPINLLTSHSHSLYTQLIQSPTQFIPTLQSQISSLFNKEIDVNFTTPLLEDSLRNPRTLKSEDFLTFRTVQGIIKKIEAPMPKIQQLVTFKNDAFETQQFSDPTIEMNVNQANSFIIRKQQRSYTPLRSINVQSNLKTLPPRFSRTCKCQNAQNYYVHRQQFNR